MRWIAGILVCLTLSNAGAGDAPDVGAREAFADGDVAAGILRYRSLLEERPGDPEAETWALMLVRGLSLAADHGAAVEAGRSFAARFPDSRFREKVAFLTARSLLATGDGGAASALMAESLERLGTSGRALLVERLIEEAGRARAGRPAAGPFDDGVAPDPDRAFGLLATAEVLGFPPDRRDGLILQMATVAVEAHVFDEALEVLEARSDPDTHLLRARALLGKKQRKDARQAIETLLAVAPESPLLPEALLLLGDGDHLARFAREFPRDPRAPDAALRRGRQLGRATELDRAVEAYDGVRKTWPEAPEAEEAAFAAAEALAAAERHPAAKGRFEAFLREYPTSARRAAARSRLLEVWLALGKAHLEAGRIDEATSTWARLRDGFALTPEAPTTLLLEAGARDDERALALLAELLARYPESEAAPLALLRAAEVLSRRPGRFAESVATLRRLVDAYPDSEAAEHAAERIEAMREEELAVELPAPRTSATPPTLAVRTRNIESLSGRVYRLDPVAYFREHGGFANLDRVVVEVIEPNARFEHRIPGYEPHRPIEGELEIPVSGPGTWLVVLEGGRLRATGLLVVSDITLITKDTPRRTLAFVQDATTGRPASGVRVLVRERGRTIREAVTGDDGTAVVEFEHAREVSVLAIRGDSVAHDRIEWDGWARGTSTRVHVATDRTVYRPGDEVGFRAVLRVGGGEIHVTPDGEPVRFTVTDAAGNHLLDWSGVLTEYGTAAARFALPADIHPGTYEIVTHFRDARWRHAFRVEAYRKPALFLDATPVRGDSVRGEEIALDVAATHAFGRPAADLAVRVRVTAITEKKFSLLLDRTFRTDPEGRARVVVPTLPGPDLELHVRLEARDAVGRQCRTLSVVTVPATAYHVALEAPRRRCFPGDEIRVGLLALDVRGEPVAAAGRIEVSRDGCSVSSFPIAAGRDGRAGIVFRPVEIGEYRFRFRGRDRAGHEVTAVAVVEAVAARGERLVVLADRPRYVVGDSARVEVTSPAPGLYALLSFEGEDLYGHRVVRLDATRSQLDVGIDPAFVPDVRVRLALAHGGRLHQGEDRIQVRERVLLEIEPERTDYRPGSRCRVRLRATDARGTPVSAEVAVAVVDEALFRLHPDQTPDLAVTFTPEARRDLVETASSLDFTHAGEGEEICADLLAERARRARGEQGTGVLLEERSLAEKIGPRRDRAEPPPPDEGGAYRGPGDSVPAGLRGRRTGRGKGDGAIPGVRRAFEDTAFFRADVLTGSDGTAVVEFTLPDDLTTWRITARAATHGNAFGEDRTRFTTSLPLSVRAGLPRFLREGDAVLAAAAVSNGTAEPLLGGVILRSRSGTVEDSAEVGFQLAPGLEQRVDWPLEADAPGVRELSAHVRSSSVPGDDAIWPLRTLRRGVPFRTGFAGVSGEAGGHVLTLPADRIPGADRLTLHVAPSVLHAALDGVAALRAFPHGCTEQTANRVLPVLALAEAIRRHGLEDATALPALLAASRAAVIRLTYLRNTGGLWGWWEDDPSDPEMTAYALLALARARTAGIDLPQDLLEKARVELGPLIERTTDPDPRAFLLLAQARACGPDLAAHAAAFADRGRLSPRGLAHLALAHETLQRRGPARILLEELEEHVRTGTRMDTETLGWVLAATAGPEGSSSPLARELALSLVARRAGRGFGTTRATGAAVLGLARMASTLSSSVETTRVRVTVGGETALDEEIRLVDGTDDRVAGATLQVPADRLRAGRNDVRVTIDGPAGVFYSVALTGLTHTAPADAEGLALERTHALLPSAGDAPSGTTLVRKNGVAREPRLETLRVGEAVRVTLRLANLTGVRFLALEEPLPAGFEPIPDLTRGPIAALERFDDRLVFFLTDTGASATITYVMRSEMPGTVHVPPAMAYVMYQPRVRAWSAARVLRVVALDAEIERDATAGLDAAGLWWRASSSVDSDPRATVAHVEALLARYDLLPAPRRAAWLLLARALEALGDSAGAARCFDGLVAESVTESLSLEDETRRARVYRALGRHREAVESMERACRLLLVEDCRAAKQVESAEEAELTVLDRHPFSPPSEEVWCRRADRHATRFEGALQRGEEPDVSQLTALREFQRRYPRSSASPHIAFRLARALLRAGRFEDLEREARRLARRDRRGLLADDADWFVAFALFAQGKHTKAAAAARSSLEREYRLDDGELGPSTYGRNLVHLLAQVAHVEGRVADAVRLYREVAEYAVDAREALRVLTERTLDLPAVVRIRTSATPAISFAAKNLDRVDLSIYPVDLLTYFTLEKDVHAVGDLNLDGIPSAAEVAVAIPGAGDHASHRASAPLADLGPGVYLVIARAGTDIEERCVLIVSDLEARILSHDGGVRVLVTDGADGKPVPGAFVKVALDSDLIGEGFTDPRGVFEVQGRFDGALSAVARKGSQNALAAE